MPGKNIDGRIKVLLEQLKQAYFHKAWHGTTLKGSLRGLGPKEVLWRPGPKRHNIWELVLHCAYWKYAVRRRITGEKMGSFPYKGSDWISLPEKTDAKTWKETITLMDDMHRQLTDVVASLSPLKLDITPPNSKTRNLITIIGIASHDLYHAGQIQLIKKLMKR